MNAMKGSIHLLEGTEGPPVPWGPDPALLPWFTHRLRVSRTCSSDQMSNPSKAKPLKACLAAAPDAFLCINSVAYRAAYMLL